MVQQTTTNKVELPHYDEDRWTKLKALIALLRDVSDSAELASVLSRLFQASGNVVEDVRSYHKEASDVQNWPFSGLAVFLEEIADDEERNSFFQTVLPFVLSLASRIEELAPKDGIPIGTQQSEGSIGLDRRFIGALLATGFLCAFPPALDKTSARPINFANFYAYFHRAECQITQAAKLRCFIHYFKRLENDWLQIDGQVTLIRQVLTDSCVPTLDDWLACPYPLCPFIVDHQNSLEDSGSHMLQVDFANRHIGGGVLGGGHVQEEIRFCVNPELVVSMLCMESMEDNEAIIVKGAERFSSYRGYGKTFEFDGDFQDKSERDADGNLQTTIAAIDAKSFRNTSKECQYEEHLVLRELNKALVGFYNAEVGCKLLEKDEHSCECSDQAPRDENPTDKCAPNIDRLCDVLLNSAVNKALNDVTSCVDGEILIKAMKKSVHEMFEETPEKARVYLETMISPSLPKCLKLSPSGSNSPLVPSTPPPSPFFQGLDRVGNGSGFQTPNIPATPPSTPFSGGALLLPYAMNSFADSLCKSLMACVKMTSSLAGSIATAASTPVRVAVATKEAFEKSPRNIGSPVRNGDSIISFLSHALCDEEVTQENGKHGDVTDFVQDLATLVNSAKLKRPGKSDPSGGSQNVRQNLTVKFESGGSCVESVQSSRCDLEEFASDLTTSLLNSGIKSFVKGSVAACCENEDRIPIPSEDKGVGVPGEDTSGAHGVADRFVERILSAALVEAAQVIAEDARELDSADERNSSEVSSKPDVEREDQSRDQSCDHSCLADKKSSAQETVLENALESPGGFHKLADEFSEKVIRLGMAEAANHVTSKRQSRPEDLEVNRRVEEEMQDLVENNSSEDVKKMADNSLLCNNNVNPCVLATQTHSLHKFAEDMSEATLSASVQLAVAQLRLRQGEAVIRPVATGNWGCGVFRGDPELKVLVQWAAASVASCPTLVYHTFGDRRVSRIFKVLNILRARGWKVCDVIQAVVRFCERVLKSSSKDRRPSLLSALLDTPHTTL